MKPIRKSPRMVVLGLLVLLAAGLAAAPEAQAFSYRKPITIDRTQVGVSGTSTPTLTNYPFLYDVTDTALRTIANGGHVLVPAFGLGRGQELLLILQAAQEKGQIPDFPIYVDGLVRRVCDTYLLLPETLSPRLQRQIRKGYLPFSGPNVTFVRDERDRERILAGPPACIVSSSGMLTGGPSAWYAARLVSQANASILITGYQDEESPGKRLLDVAEHKKDTLEIGGVSVPVHCQVAKYSLSAHADGAELAGYAAALHPRRVALVHGDDEARAGLRTLLTETDVLLPRDGMTLEAEEKRAGRHARSSAHTPSGVSSARIWRIKSIGSSRS